MEAPSDKSVQIKLRSLLPDNTAKVHSSKRESRQCSDRGGLCPLHHGPDVVHPGVQQLCDLRRAQLPAPHEAALQLLGVVTRLHRPPHGVLCHADRHILQHGGALGDGQRHVQGEF